MNNRAGSLYVSLKSSTITVGSGWLTVNHRGHDGPRQLPLRVGDRENLLGLDPVVQADANEFLMHAWQPEEPLMRTHLALTRSRSSAATTPATSGPAAEAAPARAETPATARGPYPRVRTAHPQALLAGDDPIVLWLVRSTLLNKHEPRPTEPMRWT